MDDIYEYARSVVNDIDEEYDEFLEAIKNGENLEMTEEECEKERLIHYIVEIAQHIVNEQS